MMEVEEQLEAIIRRAARQTRKERLVSQAVTAGMVGVLVVLGGVFGAWLATPPAAQVTAHQPGQALPFADAYRPPGKAEPFSRR